MTAPSLRHSVMADARSTLRTLRDNISAFASEEEANDDFVNENPATNLLRATNANFRERPAPEQVPRGKQTCHQTLIGALEVAVIVER